MDALITPLLRRPLPQDAATEAATAVEIATLFELARCRGAQRITIGSGRAPHSLATAHAIATRWEALGGQVADAITWPESAASWLRQATRFASADTDLWVMTGPTLGWAQMTRRLLWSTHWRPERTLATAAIGGRATLNLVGLSHLNGLVGSTERGDVWSVASGRVLTRHHHTPEDA